MLCTLDVRLELAKVQELERHENGNQQQQPTTGSLNDRDRS